MPDLLLELRSEEIPARMQRKAAGDLRKLVTDGLVEAGLTYDGAREYWTPRRLTLDIRGLTARSRDVREEKKGPSTKAPEQAIQGFLRGAGLSDISQAHVHTDPKKGDFYVAHIVRLGRAAEEIVAELVPTVIRTFPWPKSMRWGGASGPKGRRYGKLDGKGGETLRWVRPLQSIVCTWGPEHGETTVIPFEIDGIKSGDVTYGHRFHARDAITVKRFDDYVSKLEAAKVVLDAGRRKEIIAADAKNLAFARGLELVEDEGLLEEVSGLVEWPVVLMGEFEEDYLAIPPEVIRLTIRANQKCFVLRPGADAETLSNHFLLTANIEAKDGGAEIVHGNAKVVRARLSDALYFWKTDQGDLPDLDQLTGSAEKFGLDLTKPLDQRMARLDHLNVTFHAKLGTQGERVQRIAKLAEELAPVVGADPALARRSAVLAKADLTTEVVGEFPELQGAMGRKYALLQGEDASVAAAIEEHYKPQGPSDRVPADPVSIAVALADKLDTLVGFWAIDEKPTGSKDPFALRRAALGVVRILVENGVRLGLGDWLDRAMLRIHFVMPYQKISQDRYDLEMTGGVSSESFSSFVSSVLETLARSPWLQLFLRSYDVNGLTTKIKSPGFVLNYSNPELSRFTNFVESFYGGMEQFQFPYREKPDDSELEQQETLRRSAQSAENIRILRRHEISDLLSFFHDRLKVYLRDQGARHDLIDAVLASGAVSFTSPVSGGRAEGAGRGEMMSQREQPYDVEHVPPTPSLRADPPHKEEGKSGQSSNDDLLAIVLRVTALGKLLETEDGKNLLAGTKRAANILAAEEKKGTRIADAVDPALFKLPAENTLFDAVNQAESKAGQAIQNENFSAAMVALSALREPVDAFFDGVLVNDPDEAVRANRLALLARIRAATGQVADFSKISG